MKKNSFQQQVDWVMKELDINFWKDSCKDTFLRAAMQMLALGMDREYIVKFLKEIYWEVSGEYR